MNPRIKGVNRKKKQKQNKYDAWIECKDRKVYVEDLRHSFIPDSKVEMAPFHPINITFTIPDWKLS